MIDLGPQKTFKWAAFEPTDQDLRDYIRSRKEDKEKLARKGRQTVQAQRSRNTPIKSVPTKDILELSDSDDDLPTFSALVPSPKRQKKTVRDCLKSY